MALTPYLKGSVSTSIDGSGRMSKTCVWMLVDLAATSFIGWLNMEAEVAAWVGKIGDPFREPTVNEQDTEITAYTADSRFVVTSLSYVCAEGRTHYEVTYTAVQNDAVMTILNNVSVQVDSNNARTKTISYLVNVALNGDGTPNTTAIDSHLVNAGDVVLWAGEAYMIASANYDAQSPFQYTVQITAKDMSKMVLGLPALKMDAYGQRTASISWRMSKAVYDTETLPEAGAAVGNWFPEIPEKDKYIVTAVNSEPDGLLGYTVSIEAKHVAKQVTKITHSRSFTVAEGSAEEAEITYQCHTDDYKSILDKVGHEAAEEGFTGLTIVKASASQVGKQDFEVTLSTNDDENSTTNILHYSNTQSELAAYVGISSTFSKLFLTPQQCGYMRSISNMAWMPINCPVTDHYDVKVTVDQLKERDAGWTDAAILAAIHAGKLYYDSIKWVQKSDGSRVEMKDFSSITAIADVGVICAAPYLYAQPVSSTAPERQDITNKVFVPWNIYTESPVLPYVPSTGATTDWGKYEDTQLYKPHPLKFLDMPINYMDFSVVLNYKGNLMTVLHRNWNDFRANAIDKVTSSRFMDYKSENIEFSEIQDSKGDKWTQVTVQVKALLDAKWNDAYVATE